MATTMYAWSNFPVREVDSNTGMPRDRVIRVGEEVSADILGISEEDWKIVVANGSARAQPYPEAVANVTYGDSPNRYFRDLLNQASEGNLSSEQFRELQNAGLTGDEETSNLGDAAKVEELDRSTGQTKPVEK